MTSDWDEPLPRFRDASPAPAETDRMRGDAAEKAPPRDGIVSPLTFLNFVLANFLRIVLVAILFAGLGVAALRYVQFPYNATATVLVDPRNSQVTLQESVLPSIGSDAAILESMVQIMRSDGFLLGVMKQLGFIADDGKPVSQEQLKQLAQFKKNLNVERKGATYLVEVSFKDIDAQESARIANSVAASFANSQNSALSQATLDAAKTLSARLVELRAKLNRSEKAVADFAAQRGIVYLDQNNTLQQRQLGDLSAQLALARKAAEDARALYQQQLAAENSGVVLRDPAGGPEPTQLAFLRQSRAQLEQQLQQQSLTYGERHPRITQTRQQIAAINEQIRQERANLLRQLKGAADVAAQQQTKLEQQVTQLSTGLSMTDTDMVQLEALRREAAADRAIYEQFLSRNKATDELAAMKTDNVRVVSPAVPPLRSSRPSTVVVAPALGMMGALIAILGLAANGTRQRVKPVRETLPQPERIARTAPPADEKPAAARETAEAADRDSTSLLMLNRARRGAGAARPARSTSLLMLGRTPSRPA